MIHIFDFKVEMCVVGDSKPKISFFFDDLQLLLGNLLHHFVVRTCPLFLKRLYLANQQDASHHLAQFSVYI